MSSAGRSRAIDVLKIAMALFVVGIHANPLSGLFEGASLYTGDGIYRMAVPVFLVINGYYFLPVAQTGRAWGYVRRIVWLFVIWSLLYLPLSWKDYTVQSPGGLVVLVLNGYWHLWYLSSLAMAAALAALIFAWPSRALAGVTLACFLGGIAMSAAIAWQIIPVYGPVIGSGDFLHRNGLLLSLPFFLIGYLMRRHDLPGRFSFGTSALLAALGVAALPLESLIWHEIAPQGVAHDNMFATFLAAPMAVIVALKIPGAAQSRNLGLYANGIFFTHVAICGPLFRFTHLPRPVIYALTVAGAVSLTWALIRSGLSRRLL